MFSTIPTEITICFFSLVGILTGYVWNDQSKRIEKLEKFCDNSPFSSMQSDIATMKNDISWIKDNLQ